MSTHIKELEHTIATLPEGEEKINLLIELSKELWGSNIAKAIAYCDMARSIAQKNDFKEGFISAVYVLANFYRQDLFPETFHLLVDESNRLSLGLKAESRLLSLMTSGIYFEVKSKRAVSFEYYTKANQVLIEHPSIDSTYHFKLYANFATLCLKLDDQTSALMYYKQALNHCIDTDENYAVISANIALLEFPEDSNQVLQMMNKSIEIFKSTGNTTTLATVYNKTGDALIKRKNYNEALKCFGLSLECNAPGYFGVSYRGLAECYLNLGQFDNALECLKIADEIYSRSGVDGQNTIDLLYSKAYAGMGAFEKAYEYCNKALDYLSHGERVIQNQTIKDMERLNFKQEAEIERLKSTELNSTHNEIKSSLRYAKRLQFAFNTQLAKIKELIPGFFGALYIKDQVSGDFVWARKSDSRTLIAVADCTGHGVPGALMTVAGNFLLNQIVDEKKCVNPSEILQSLNRELLSKFVDAKNYTNELVLDGMDVALCSFDFENNTMEYAGANRPLYLIRDGLLHETSPTKASIGGYSKENQQYETHIIPIKKEDVIYLFSDGYTDQFGGEKNKKFTSKRFKELLLGISQKDEAEQRKLLRETFINWIGSQSQTDDILVVGIRV